jgi:hypothetical protein
VDHLVRLCVGALLLRLWCYLWRPDSSSLLR